MRRICSGFIGLVLGGFVLAVSMAEAAGDPENGARVFRACVACHSLEPGRNMTGPSLANIWGQKAASVKQFPRYSEELQSAEIEWNADTRSEERSVGQEGVSKCRSRWWTDHI